MKISKLRFSYDSLISISCIIMIAYANYNALIDKVLGTTLRLGLIAGTLFIGLIPYLKTGIRKSHVNNWSVYPFLIFVLLILLDNNRDLHGGTMFFSLRTCAALLFVLFSNHGKRWYEKIPDYIIGIGFLNVAATLFFFVFRSAYRVMFKIYGYYPTGTKHGTAGYSAGIANHYSQNATYIAYVFLSVAVLAMTTKEKRKRKKYIIATIITFIALLLTQKRGHLLFSVAALLGAYLIESKGSIIKKSVKTAFASVSALAAFYLLSYFVEPIASLLERFSTAGTDPESLTRFAMWQLCIDKFKTSPLFGIGWAQFPEQYFQNLYVSWFDEKYKYLNAHNVYLQVLCETGIVGISIYLIVITTSLLTVIFTIKKIKAYYSYMPSEYRSTLVFSLAVQLFYVLYCMTGNGLYDYSFYFYMLAVSSAFVINRKLKNYLSVL